MLMPSNGSISKLVALQVTLKIVISGHIVKIVLCIYLILQMSLRKNTIFNALFEKQNRSIKIYQNIGKDNSVFPKLWL